MLGLIAAAVVGYLTRERSRRARLIAFALTLLVIGGTSAYWAVMTTSDAAVRLSLPVSHAALAAEAALDVALTALGFLVGAWVRRRRTK